MVFFLLLFPVAEKHIIFFDHEAVIVFVDLQKVIYHKHATKRVVLNHKRTERGRTRIEGSFKGGYSALSCKKESGQSLNARNIFRKIHFR